MRRLPLLFIAVASALAFSAGPAHAAGDNTLASSSPTAGEVVTLAPTQLQLKFTLPVGGAEIASQMGLSLACESKLTNLGPPQLSADGVTISAALTQVPQNGSCVVNWSLPDGSTGSFNFTAQTQVTTTVPVTVPGAPATTVPVDGTAIEVVAPRLGGPIGLMKLIVFFAVSALFGGLMFIKLVWPEGVEYGITEKYFRQVSIIAGVAIFVLIILMTARQSGGGITSSISPTSWGPLFESNEGRAVFLRLLIVGGLGFYAWITERVLEPTNVVPTTVLLALMMMSYGFDRATGRAVVLGIVIAIVHMAFTAMWVGSIAIIWRVILHGPGDVDLVDALRGWARLATPLTIGIVGTGVFQVWRIDGISLINSGHGRVVILKVLLVTAMLFVSAAVRQFILRGMQRAKSLNEKVVYRLKRPVGIEMSLSIVVLATSSWLMAMRPPYVLNRETGPRVEYAIVQDMTAKDDFHVRLSITPGDVGANRILIELFGPSRIQNFVVTLTPTNPNFSGYTINVPITRPGGALVAQDAGLLLRAPGEWTATVTGVTTIGELTPMTTTFTIADGTTVTTEPKQGLKKSTTTIAVATTTTSVAPVPATTTVAPTTTSTTTVPVPVETTTTVPAAG
ncbi:MAG: CopD family protein [Ilumatobacteraceae bacterium]|nr:CopD family protein [Ilumatobacteraceae bacterium]